MREMRAALPRDAWLRRCRSVPPPLRGRVPGRDFECGSKDAFPASGLGHARHGRCRRPPCGARECTDAGGVGPCDRREQPHARTRLPRLHRPLVRAPAHASACMPHSRIPAQMPVSAVARPVGVPDDERLRCRLPRPYRETPGRYFRLTMTARSQAAAPQEHPRLKILPRRPDLVPVAGATSLPCRGA